MALLLGIDLGTSYFKVGLFDLTGALRGLGRVAVATTTPAPGRVELPVERFWALLRAAVAEALAAAHAAGRDVVALSYSSQANSFVLLDGAGRPVSPVVLWTDTRAGEVPPGFASFAASDAFRRTVGFEGLSAGAAVVKWDWFRRHDPTLWRRVRHALTLSDYLTHALTGEWVGDASTAALLGLYDLRRRCWWPEALSAFGLDPAWLATPRLPGSAGGGTTEAASTLLGLPAGLPFALGGLDHHVAAVGAGLGGFADASISTGTVLAAVCLVEEVAPAPGCFHGPHVDGRRFYRLAFDPAGASRLEALQRRFAPERTLDELLTAAAAEPAGCRPGAPRGSEPVRAARELMDAIAAAQRRLVLTVTGGRMPRQISATGGGARSAPWLALKARTIGAPIATSASPERGCLGAALFAAVAAGLYPDLDAAAAAMVRADRVIAPA